MGQTQSNEKELRKEMDNKVLLDNVYTALSTCQELSRRATLEKEPKLLAFYDAIDYSGKSLSELRNQLIIQLYSVSQGMLLFKKEHGQFKYGEKFSRQKMTQILGEFSENMRKFGDTKSEALMNSFQELIWTGHLKADLKCEDSATEMNHENSIKFMIGINTHMNEKEQSYKKDLLQKGKLEKDPILNHTPCRVREIEGELKDKYHGS